MSASEAVVEVAFLPSGGGMGHLNPFLKIAALLLQYGCKVTFITRKSSLSPPLRFALFTDFNLIPMHIRQTVIIITKIINVNKS